MRYWLVLVLAVFCFSLSASSQTAEELVNKNIEAKGGMNKIEAILRGILFVFRSSIPWEMLPQELDCLGNGR